MAPAQRRGRGLIEPTGLRPNHSMSLSRDEEMTGTRLLGLPCQHPLASGDGPQRVPDPASQGDDHEALRASQSMM